MIVSLQANGNIGDVVTGVSFNGVSGTRLFYSGFIAGLGEFYVYYIANVGSTTANVTVTYTGAINTLYGDSYSYTGVSSNASPDNSAQGTTANSVSITPVATNAWGWAVLQCGGSQPSASNFTSRGFAAIADLGDAGDKNATISGATTFTTTGGTGTFQNYAVTLAPFVAASSNVPRSLLGVGI